MYISIAMVNLQKSTKHIKKATKPSSIGTIDKTILQFYITAHYATQHDPTLTAIYYSCTLILIDRIIYQHFDFKLKSLS